MITKSLAGVLAGAVLVGGGALATAQAEPTSPNDNPTAVAPVAPTASAQAAAAPYPASVFTTTGVEIARKVVRGERTFARVVVTAGAVNRKPHGIARLWVANKVRRAEVKRGEALVPIPRKLRADRWFTARVRYRPTEGSQFKTSASSDRFRVVRGR